jgi:bifunctional NMN adenylyltransferase/nudix hydrolase
MKKINVVIGRFQVPAPHVGHKHLINTAKANGDGYGIVLGHGEGQVSSSDPLPLPVRMDMMLEEFPDATILSVSDHPSDEEWSRRLDQTLEEKFPGCNISLYGSRDSFSKYYSGKFLITIVPEISAVSGTEIRKANLVPKDNESFRMGMIEAAKRRFPTSFQTVDVGLVNHQTKEILLGRKEKDPKGFWRLPGGFVDPKDESLESAAARELSEEVLGVMTHEFTYLGSKRVADFRYKNGPDKILTALFLTYLMGGVGRAGDDLAEVKWFPLASVINQVLPQHKALVQLIIDTVNK